MDSITNLIVARRAHVKGQTGIASTLAAASLNANKGFQSLQICGYFFKIRIGTVPFPIGVVLASASRVTRKVTTPEDCKAK
jgi:hypothetical protein